MHNHLKTELQLVWERMSLNFSRNGRCISRGYFIENGIRGVEKSKRENNRHKDLKLWWRKVYARIYFCGQITKVDSDFKFEL